MLKISQRKRYIKNRKALTSTSKDDELHLLGDDVDSFTVSNADFESAADNLFTSPPRLAPTLQFIVSQDTSQDCPTTPGTALQQTIETKLEKSLGYSLNVPFRLQC